MSEWVVVVQRLPCRLTAKILLELEVLQRALLLSYTVRTATLQNGIVVKKPTVRDLSE